MTLLGSPLGRPVAPTPPTIEAPPRRRKSFISISPSITGSGRTSKLRLTRSNSVSQKTDGNKSTSSPSTSSTNTINEEKDGKDGEPRAVPVVPSPKPAGMGASKDFLMKRRQFMRGESIAEGSVQGTILRAVPQADGPSPSSSTSSLVSSRMFNFKSKSRKGSAVESPVSAPSRSEDDLSQQQNTATSSIQRDSIMTPCAESEIHPDFLGVWNDGTVHWAQEASSPKLEIESIAPRAFLEEKMAEQEEAEKAIEPPLKSDRRSLRPKIQVTIPEARRSVGDVSELPPRSPLVKPDEVAVIERPQSASSMYSISTHQLSVDTSGHTTLRQSTLTQMMNDMTTFENFSSTALPTSAPEPPATTSSASLSASSDDHLDDDASSTYSGRSSVSSATMDVVFKPSKSRSASAAYSIVTPGLAGVYEENVPEVPALPKSLRSMQSQMSIADLSNKPLPPEPLEMAPAPLTILGRHCMKPVDLKSPSPNSTRSVSPPSDPLPPPRRPAPPRKPARGLKSKYSFSDLDAIDQAFQRTSPNAEVLTLVQAEEALQLQLSTISEDQHVEQGPFGWDPLPRVQPSPLQIARGPMEMAPSRAAPPPPPPQPERPMKLEKKALRVPNAKNHITSQLKSPTRLQAPPLPPLPPQQEIRQDSYRGKWTMKSIKGLGRNPSGDNRASFIDTSNGANLTTLPTTPNYGNPRSPTTSQSSNAAIHDLNKRLELLKMRERSEAFRMEAFRMADKREEFQTPIPYSTAAQLRQSFYRAPSVVVPRCDQSEALERRGHRVASGVPSLVSLTVSDIPGWYENMPPSGMERPMSDGSLAKAENDRNISADAAELVLLKVLQSLTNLQDLFSAAVVSKGFYRIYKKNELSLMQNALRGMSTAAWELREMTPPFADGNDLDCDRPVPDYTPQTYLRYYTRDMYIMVALKSLMLVRCESQLRPETVSALAGNDDERSLQLDDAFWRVWTFCKIFGSNKNRESDIVGQMDWLRGGVIAHQNTCSSSLANTDTALGISSALLNPPESFGLGNGRDGLTPNQLWDMKEIWTCLRVLIEGFAGKREMARDFGVFGDQGTGMGNAGLEDALIGPYHPVIRGR